MNNHQRFTGYNIHGSNAHGRGTWRSLTGDPTDIREIFCRIAEREPTEQEIGDALWRLGWSTLYGEAISCPTLADYERWLTSRYQRADRTGNGLRHDYRTARGTWLYPGDREYWLASQRMMLWPDEKIDRYLELDPIRLDSDHVVICCSTGRRPALAEEPFDALANEARVRSVFERVIAHDKAPVAWLCSQEHYLQQLDGNHTKLIDKLEHTAALVADLSSFLVPMRELGDVYSGRYQQQRTDVFRAMRRGAPLLPLACHERPLEQIPVDDFAGLENVISLLQTGFDTPTGGRGRREDKVYMGSHVYDGAAGFVEANTLRMDRWQAAERIGNHLTAVGEHSIPLVWQGQPWKPTRTLADARRRGKVLLEHGAAFDLSAGATR